MNSNVLILKALETFSRLHRHTILFQYHKRPFDAVVRQVPFRGSQRKGVDGRHAETYSNVGLVKRVFVVEGIGQGNESAEPVLTGLGVGDLVDGLLSALTVHISSWFFSVCSRLPWDRGRDLILLVGSGSCTILLL